MADQNAPADAEHPDAEHPDAAGWVLGVLDPEESALFEAHLPSCPDCQQAVTEFGSTARLLKTALPVMESMPAAEPPPDLQARTVARVERAARKRTWRRWNTRVVAAAAVVVVGAGTVTAVSLTQATPALAFTIPLHPASASTVQGPASPSWARRASGQASAHHTANGWSIQLTVDHLKQLPSGYFYECWYAGPGNRPGHPDLITAGTFNVGPSGNATVQMWSAADPRTFPVMEITIEQPGDGAQHGQVLLSGTAEK
jgi:Anti-sigma-K factor rskA/Putative zinc-finger